MGRYSNWSLQFGLAAALAMAGPARAQAQATASQPGSPAQNSDAQTDAAKPPKDAKSSPAAKKVYTNDDLRSAKQEDVSVVGNSKQASRPGANGANEPKNEQYWRSRAQKLRNEMADVDRQIAQFQSSNQNQHDTPAGANGTNPPPESAYYTNSRASMRLQNLKNRKASIQAAMDQLEEEARKANVPPGWLR